MATRSTRTGRTNASSRANGRPTGGARSTSNNMGRQSGSYQNNSSRGGSSMKIPVVIIAVLLVIGLGFGVASFIISPSKSSCDKVVEKFQTACNNLDAFGVVDCLKPTTTNQLIKLGTAVAGDEAVDLIMDLIGSGLDLAGIGENVDARSLFQTIKLEPKSYGFPLSTRKVECKASFMGLSQYVNIYITKYKGDAYITKVEFSKK